MDYLLPLAQLSKNVAAIPEKNYLHQPRDRQWFSYTWREVDLQARKIASGLLAQGFVPGDRIAIMAKNSAEWFITDYAIMMAGMISVPIYATAGEATIRHVLSQSEARALFIGKLDSSAALEASLPPELPTIAFPYPEAEALAKEQFNDWLKEYEPLQELHDPDPDEIISIVYTSGSTGLPKGVASTYRNFASSSAHTAALFAGKDGERCMSYLPLAHITERCVIEYMSLYSQIEVYFVESLDTFIADVQHARPTLFISVPRLWTKFQAEILAKLPDEKLQKLLRIPLVGRLVAGKIRKSLGLDKVRLFGSGSAPISPDILHWYARIGMNISEGWGMTEATGLACSSIPFEQATVGTIGTPLDCVEMKLSSEGELLVRGEAIFTQYYRNPEATAEAFVDGWFRTGDKAEQRDDGVWKIIGRVKEQFKTGKGKYVSPVPIESMLARNPDIEQICVMGSGRKQPIAVVVLNEQMRGYRTATNKRLQNTLSEVNSELEAHQRLDHIIVSDDVWSVENDLLTPTLKIRRNLLEERYGDYLVKTLDNQVVWEADPRKTA